MEAELKILSLIGENENVTQRGLSAKTDISLGTINVLLKKMMEKGFIKIEKLSTRTVRYILTHKGMMEKAKKTYDYIKRTYENILLMKGELEQIIKDLPENSTLYLYGEADEVYGMLTLLLNEMVASSGIWFRKIEVLEEMDGKGVVVIWNDADRDKLAGVKYVNILECMV